MCDFQPPVGQGLLTAAPARDTITKPSLVVSRHRGRLPLPKVSRPGPSRHNDKALARCESREKTAEAVTTNLATQQQSPRSL